MTMPFDDEIDPARSEAKPELRRVPLEFHGTGVEYFKIWIVNMALSVVTLGIYSAWAKVRTRRYFHGNTRIDGSAFEYLANPVAILKGRIVAAAALGAYGVTAQFFPFVSLIIALALFLVAPWVIVKALRFNARVTAFRNVRFDFKGTFGQAYTMFVIYPILTIPTLGLLTPFVLAKSTSFMFSGHRYGNRDFTDELPTGSVYTMYGIILIASIPLSLFLFYLMVSNIGIPQPGEVPSPTEIIQAFLPVYAVALLAGLLIQSFISARMRNLLLNNSFVGDNAWFASRVNTGELFAINLGYGALTLLTLGLAYPWLEVRKARYLADCTTVVLNGTLDDVVDEAAPAGSAAADQLGEAFDLGVDFGF